MNMGKINYEFGSFGKINRSKKCMEKKVKVEILEPLITVDTIPYGWSYYL